LHVSTLSDLQQAFARLHPAQDTIARFLVLPPRLKALSDPFPLELAFLAETRFPFAFGLLTLKLAVTANSPARVSRRNV
jgi:hypothetical protein